MEFAWLPWETPERMLAWEEAFLEVGELEGREILWLWEAPCPFVVLGYGQHMHREVDWDACQRDQVAVRRRCSGGGAVVQGEGCLNYGLVLQVARTPELESVVGTNRWVMGRVRDALNSRISGRIEVQGVTDLTLDNRKVSGNAQRRRRRALLFHGTLLMNFDVGRISRWLRFPSIAPEYRQGRSHEDFVMNLPLTTEDVGSALREVWNAGDGLQSYPFTTYRRLVKERYGHESWHHERRVETVHIPSQTRDAGLEVS